MVGTYLLLSLVILYNATGDKIISFPKMISIGTASEEDKNILKNQKVKLGQWDDFVQMGLFKKLL